MKREENMKFWRIILLKKKNSNTPPPPRNLFTPPPHFFFYTNFFLSVGNSMKRLWENMKFWKKKFQILFF